MDAGRPDGRNGSSSLSTSSLPALIPQRAERPAPQGPRGRGGGPAPRPAAHKEAGPRCARAPARTVLGRAPEEVGVARLRLHVLRGRRASARVPPRFRAPHRRVAARRARRGRTRLDAVGVQLERACDRRAVLLRPKSQGRAACAQSAGARVGMCAGAPEAALDSGPDCGARACACAEGPAACARVRRGPWRP